MQGWVLQLSILLLPPQIGGASPDGSGGKKRSKDRDVMIPVEKEHAVRCKLKNTLLKVEDLTLPIPAHWAEAQGAEVCAGHLDTQPGTLTGPSGSPARRWEGAKRTKTERGGEIEHRRFKRFSHFEDPEVMRADMTTAFPSSPSLIPVIPQVVPVIVSSWS